MLNALPGVGIGNPVDTVDIPGSLGGAYLTFGTTATGPFASKLIAYLAGANANAGILAGGRASGSDVDYSLIGDSSPDLVLTGEVVNTLTISDGAKIGAKASPIEVGSTAEVRVTLPGGWNSAEAADSIIPDINGDGIADVCIGSQVQPGGVLILW